MAGAPNSGTVVMGLLGTVVLVPVCILRQLPATASVSSSMELGPSVGLLSVPLNDLHSTGVVGGGRSDEADAHWRYEHVTVTMVPEPRWPE